MTNDYNSISKNMVGLLFFIGVVFAVILNFKFKSNFNRLCILFFMLSVLLTLSRGVMLISLLYFLFLYRKHLNMKNILSGVIGAVIVVSMFAKSEILRERINTMDVTQGTQVFFQGNNYIRTALVLASIQVSVNNPFVGVGAGNQPKALSSYVSKLPFLKDHQIRHLLKKEYGAHNFLLRLFNEYGMLAVFCLVFLLQVFKRLRTKSYSDFLGENFKLLFGLMLLYSFSNDIILSSIFFIFIIFFLKSSNIKYNAV